MKSQYKKLISNTGALFSIQLANYLLPLLLIPYLTRVMGVEGYGIVAFGLALVQIACILTDYGFSLSATYQIATQQNDKEALRKIICAVSICKIILAILACSAITVFAISTEKYSEHSLYFLLLTIPILGQTFQPIWFFQGIERMMFITLYTVANRILFLFLVIVLVNGMSEIHWIAIANGISATLAALIGITVMFSLGYTPKWCGFKFIWTTFTQSTEFFWSRAAVATYTAGGSIFLGITSTPTQVAYYSAAEQLYKGAQSLFGPVSQALYPHMAKYKNFKLFFKILKYSIVLSIIGLITGVIIGSTALQFIFGEEFRDAYPVLLIFMITFTITIPSVLLGYPFLSALGNPKAVNMSVIFGSIIQLTILSVLYFINSKQASTIVFSVLITEIFILFYRAKFSIQEYKLVN